MTTNSPACPVCNNAVDTLRSRFVGVRDGKVVAYCSAACAAKGAGASGGIPSRLATPPAGLPSRLATPVAGVPARLATPAAGIPVAIRGNGELSSGPPRPVTPPPGVPVLLESGPVIEVVRDPASAGVISTSASRADRSEPRAKHPDEIPIAAFWTADKEKSGAVRTIREATGPVRRPDASLPPPIARAQSESDAEDMFVVRKSRAPLVLLILVLLAAGGFAIYHFTFGSAPAAATRLVPEPAPGAAVEAAPSPPAAPVIGPEQAVAQARATLRSATAATSPRVSRLAAAALARTDDPAARDLLARQLGLPAAATGSASPQVTIETSDIARLDLAYSLARGHDKRGRDALGAALASQRAEVRDEAARLLALLGDPRAVPHLTDLLAVSQRRLGAAEHLAHLAEPHAVKALEQLRADPKAPADDKARATIALGLAGHADTAPALRDMLGDAHFNAFAAAALAELKDAAARPVLERQLDSPMLRVRAARALRRLEPGLDAHALVSALLEVTRSGRDTDQVQAAEAILLLAGPVAWSSYE